MDARERQLDALLKNDANARPDLRPRDPPRLQRRSDGTHRWKSKNLSATIAADGTVAFQDRPQVEHAGFASWLESQPNDRIAATIAPGKEDSVGTPTGGLRFRFDAFDLLVGGTYNAERAKFMDSTSNLREVLALRERLCGAANPTRLREHLECILEDSTLTFQQRRRAVFDAFDACSDSPLRKTSERMIREFVLANFPKSSPNAFPDRELATLNEHRIGSRELQPYKHDYP